MIINAIRRGPLLGFLLLCSCGVSSFRSDFIGYNKAYAGMLNQQMLLNLARLDNGHPPYFMAPGAIDARYDFNQEAGTSLNRSESDGSSSSSTSNVTDGVLGLASQVIGATSNTVSSVVGNVKVGRSENPAFKIIPLNDTEISRQVISPIPNDVFYALYQQGYPLDLLMRVMVERIEIVAPGRKDELVNSPTRSSARAYVNFLNTCAILREIQAAGHLDFTLSERFVPLADFQQDGGKQQPVQSGPPPAAPAEGTELLPPIEPGAILGAPGPIPPSPPGPEKIMAARKDGYDYQLVDGQWKFGVWSKYPVFSIPTRSSALAAQLRQEPALQGIDHAGIDRTISILKTGLNVKAGSGDNQRESTRLVLRSYARVLEGTASEQSHFGAFITRYGSEVAPSQRQPVVRTRWEGVTDLEKPLVELSYHNKRYAITDPKGSNASRDAFRLLVALSSQVSVDISKFQNQYLEVR